MKTIILFRHGKSDWDAPFGHDHERPLAKRGVRDAKRMGRFLAEAGPLPDLCITSTAVRARTTVELAHEAGEWLAEIRATEQLYHAGAQEVLNLARSVSAETTTLLLAGHQPTWSVTIERLIGGGSVTVPTAAMARIDVMAERWSDVGWGDGSLIWLVIPKALKA
ncbi:MAG: histidine phosphatase family protein [Rubricoccaceae bacterium]|nr:histidine phosphatase family protein [Rubricoccaceae bacterium]